MTYNFNAALIVMPSCVSIATLLAVLVVAGVGDLSKFRKQTWTERLPTFCDVGVLSGTFTLYLYLLTHGTGLLIGAEMLGPAYDSLADHLVNGSAEVGVNAIAWEAFKVDHSVFMYFGPFPALLRIVGNTLFPQMYGHWSRLSCFIALSVSVFAFVSMLRYASRLRSDQAHTPRLLDSLLLFGFCLGTPLVFVSVVGSIYHESALWGLACSLAGLSCFFRIIDSESWNSCYVLLLAVAAGGALLSRVLFGGPLYIVIALIGTRYLLQCMQGGSLRAGVRQVAVSISPAVIALGFQLWYNHARFGSILTFIDFHHLRYVAENPKTWNVLSTFGTFSILRLPSGLLNFFGFPLSTFLPSFPFVRVVHPYYLNAELYPPEFNEYVLSLLVASPWLLFGAVAGMVAGLKHRGNWRGALFLGAFFVQAVLVLCYYIVTQRYALDLLPILCAYLVLWLRSCGPLRRGTIGMIAVLVTWSAFASVLSTLSWIPVSNHNVPKDFKRRWQIAVPDQRGQHDAQVRSALHAELPD